MQYFFDIPQERRGTACYKWDKTPIVPDAGAPSPIPMGIADMDLPCPEPVVTAIHRRADDLIFGYTDYTEEFHEAVRGFYLRHMGWDIPSHQLFHLGGVVPGVEAAVELFTQPDAGVIVQTPVYDPFFRAVRGKGRHTVYNRLLEKDGSWYMNLEELEQLCADPCNTMMILCSPHNPSGRVWTADELKAVLDICRRNDVIVVCDEIHCDLIRSDVVHHPILTIADDKDKVILFNAPSKTFNIPGMHMANAVIANEELAAVWAEKGPCPMPNPLSLAAATAAYKDGDEWLEQVLAYLDGNFAAMKEFMDANLPRCGWNVPQGTYLAWVDCRSLPVDAVTLQQRMAKEQAVFFVDGSCYEGAGFLRINIACPRSMMMEALQRLADLIKGQ